MATTTTPSPHVEDLNSMLRGEISAVETYNQALPIFDGKPEAAELRRIRDEHQKAIDLIRSHIQYEGAEATDSSGPWGYFTAAITGTAKIAGPQTTLAALRRGEEHGEGVYLDMLQNEKEMKAECRDLIRRSLLLPTRDHMQTLDRLIKISEQGSI